MQIQHNQTIWLNLANPENKDLVFLRDELKISPQVLKELLGFNKRPKIEEYDNYLFLIMHFPVFHEDTRQTVPTELDFIVTQNQVITIYQNTNPSLEKFFDEVNPVRKSEDLNPSAFSEKGSGLYSSQPPQEVGLSNGVKNDNDLQANYFRSPAYLLFCILDRLIDSCLPMLDHIHEKIETAEQNVFAGKEKEMLKEIAIVKRDIIDFRRTIKPQRLVLELLGKKINRFFKQDFDFIAQEVIGSEVRVWNTLENHKELIEAIEKTNEGLLSFQINRVMHTLTLFSIILFSLTFITSFFSMQMVKNILVGHPLGIWYVIGIMLADVLLITILFKRKKWM